MRGTSQRSINRIWVSLAILGAAGIGGLVAGLNARAALGPSSSGSVVAEMPAVDVVNLRFPADWTEVAAAESEPQTMAYASAYSSMLCSPKPSYAKPTYALSDAGSAAGRLP